MIVTTGTAACTGGNDPSCAFDAIDPDTGVRFCERHDCYYTEEDE